MIIQKKKIVLLPGDGIGPEIMRAAVRVLKECGAEFGQEFEFAEFPFGGCAIDATGEPLPAETLAACKAADAILLGAVGGPKWDAVPLGKRPESGLLALRKTLGLYINLRPIDLHASLYGLSPLRVDRASDVHIDFVRELAESAPPTKRYTQPRKWSASPSTPSRVRNRERAGSLRSTRPMS
jgi:3-isopropylmalate dehydrogenase